MKKGRIEAIKQFGDKLANWISQKRDRNLYRALTYDSPWELRQRLLRAQREGCRWVSMICDGMAA